MAVWFLAVMLALQSAPALPPEAATRIAPVEAAIRAERQRQAGLPPPSGDAEKLTRMVDIEQAGRKAAIIVDLHDLPKPERDAAMAAMWAPIATVDKANQADLLAMLPPEGWFYTSKYGPAASRDAFLIIQHGDLDLWRRFVPVLEPLVAKGEVSGETYGMMFDRLAISEGRPQRYGSQMTCRAGKLVVDRLEDPLRVDERRRAIGFRQTLAE